MPKKEKIRILIAFAVSMGFLCIFYLTSNITPRDTFIVLNQTTNASIEPTVLKKEISNTKKAVLEINGRKYESEIIDDMSVYDFMTKLKNERKISFKDKNYPTMGKLIEEINKVKNNGGKNWIYYVNEKKATIGVSNYKIRSGDVVSWKLESSY